MPADKTDPANGGTVTRADLSESVYRRVGLSRRNWRNLSEPSSMRFADAVERGEMVKLSSFGSFVVRSKGKRIGRNPKPAPKRRFCRAVYWSSNPPTAEGARQWWICGAAQRQRHGRLEQGSYGSRVVMSWSGNSTSPATKPRWPNVGTPPAMGRVSTMRSFAALASAPASGGPPATRDSLRLNIEPCGGPGEPVAASSIKSGWLAARQRRVAIPVSNYQRGKRVRSFTHAASDPPTPRLMLIVLSARIARVGQNRWFGNYREAADGLTLSAASPRVGTSPPTILRCGRASAPGG